ncbi:MAG TPA: HNH endonuclease [Stellaceae bacterium]|nr:HNH endonuclease [Stellaceae bacterium]
MSIKKIEAIRRAEVMLLKAGQRLPDLHYRKSKNLYLVALANQLKRHCGFGSVVRSWQEARQFIERRWTGGSTEAISRPLPLPVPAVASAKLDVTGDEFLQTHAWKQLRYKALRKYGRRCQCCGATPESGAIMNVDHIKPRRRFPELALRLDNLQVLCGDCNQGKGNWDQTDWRDPEPAIDEQLDSALLSELREAGRLN